MIIIQYHDRNVKVLIWRICMRYNKGHKESTRQNIIDVASKKFRKYGIDSVGLAELMKDAGLTNGAFYSHFKSKKDLVDQVLTSILDKREAYLLEIAKQELTLEEFIREYLTNTQRQVRSWLPFSFSSL